VKKNALNFGSSFEDFNNRFIDNTGIAIDYLLQPYNMSDLTIFNILWLCKHKQIK